MDPRTPDGGQRRGYGERWLDEAAGPVVRPYAMTRGRTAPEGARLDLVTILVATGRRPPEQMRVSPEQRRLLTLAARHTTVADLASETNLPLGVVRVLLGDLVQHDLLAVQSVPAAPNPASALPADFPERPDRLLLTRVLNDLRSL